MKIIIIEKTNSLGGFEARQYQTNTLEKKSAFAKNPKLALIKLAEIMYPTEKYEHTTKEKRATSRE